MRVPFLRLEGVGKSYPGVRALQDVSLDVMAGEVIGLAGENGAGKSTLMKILGGVVAPDTGSIVIDGIARPRLTVKESMAAGIAFVHQELNLFENLSVAANIYIGREPLHGGPLRLVDERRLAANAAPLLEQLGADFSVGARLSDLSLAQMQLVEIAKAMSLQSRLLILDEPTSSLTATETERLLRVLGRLRSEGVAVILVTHRLTEIERAADRAIVLRDGRAMANLDAGDLTADTMTKHMIGRNLSTLYRPPKAPPGLVALEIRQVRTTLRPREPVSLSVRSGEILGLAGLIGAGRSELATGVFGLAPLLAGEVFVRGRRLPLGDPRRAVEYGLYLVPEDRKRSGLVLDFSISSNVMLSDLSACSRFGLIDSAAERAIGAEQMQKLDIRAASPQVPVKALSGGNQQKTVLAKWLRMHPHVLMFDEPTRGVDVRAKQEIYALMRSLADGGVGILMISSDMEEVIGVSDRVAVMHEGRIAGTLERAKLSEQSILALATGRTHDTGVAETR